MKWLARRTRMATIETAHHVAKSRYFLCRSNRSNAMPTLNEEKEKIEAKWLGILMSRSDWALHTRLLRQRASLEKQIMQSIKWPKDTADETMHP